MKNVQIQMDEATYEVVKLSAKSKGLTVTAYMRMLAIADASASGYQSEQPRAD
tara:strand:+ start:350 stop:508 length:159 start_codon:yes stop_codon:yes gene_type:complete